MAFAFIFESAGFGEWFILLAVVLIVVGPKNLPSTARKIGQYYSKFRRAAESFKRQIMDMDTEFDRYTREMEKSVETTMKGSDLGGAAGETHRGTEAAIHGD